MLRVIGLLFLLSSSSCYGQTFSLFPAYNDTPEVEKLARSITDTLQNDSLKVQALYRWVTSNISYDHERFRWEKENRQTLLGVNSMNVTRGIVSDPFQQCSMVLKTRKAICRGYTYLFVSLCKAIRVHAEPVGGYGKTDKIAEPKDVGHMWVAFQLGTTWYLADPTWDAAIVLARPTKTNAQYDYFMTSPNAFVETHLPNDPMFQLLRNPVSANYFWKETGDKYSSSPLAFQSMLSVEKSFDEEQKMLRRAPRMYEFDPKDRLAQLAMIMYYSLLGMQSSKAYNLKNKYINNSQNLASMASRAMPIKQELHKLLDTVKSCIDKAIPLLTALQLGEDARTKLLNEYRKGLSSLKVERESLSHLYLELEEYQKKHRVKL